MLNAKRSKNMDTEEFSLIDQHEAELFDDELEGF